MENPFTLNKTQLTNKLYSLSKTHLAKQNLILTMSLYSLFNIHIVTPQPCIEIQLLPTKFEKTIKAITYMDMGVQKMMINPNILSKEAWKKEVAYFVAIDRKVFRTNVVTKAPIRIKFFLECIIWTKVIGSKLPNKGILIRMDVYSITHRLHILPIGIKFKREFKPYLKLNEDINPTKAIHLGNKRQTKMVSKLDCPERGCIWYEYYYIEGKRETISKYEIR
ncbi:hypothetical protein CR513_10511, partial [Mucuna pruriens]